MKIFHICNNYVSSLVHEKLIENLAKPLYKNKQLVYIPTRERVVGGSSNHDFTLAYDHVITPKLIKFFPLLKVLKVFYSVVSKYRRELKNADLIVGYTLWSDGGICFLISKLFKKEYILCVRNTDLNIFLKYLKHYRVLQRYIFNNAKYVVFISYANYNTAIDRYQNVFPKADKIKIIPNGVDDYWLENINCYRPKTKDNENFIKLIYVGRLDSNKNLISTYQACLQLLDSKYQVFWTIIGGEVVELIDFLKLKSLPAWISHFPTTNDKDFIRQKYQENDVFIMPSYRETFGLVYVEAITQGCVCICSSGQGIDGFFDGFNVIETCNPHQVESIKNAIICALKKSESIKSNELPSYLIDNFSWTGVAKKYVDLFTGK